MNLRPRMLLVFAVTIVCGMGVLHFLSRDVLLSSFQDLETEQMRQNVHHALTELEEEYNDLGRTTNDYAYWDRTYNFLGNPPKGGDIGEEFQSTEMDGLGLNLVIIRDLQGKIVFAKAYDTEKHQEARAPTDFLQQLFRTPQLSTASVARYPRDGLIAFPDAVYLVSLRPILNSQREGDSRGILLIARKFDGRGPARFSDLTPTSLRFARLDSSRLPPDFQLAREALAVSPSDVEVRPSTGDLICGYAIVNDLLGDPLFIFRVDTRRPIYQRGQLSQFSLFGTQLASALIFSLLIIFLLQKFVLSRLSGLSHQIESIGNRHVLAERVRVTGRDEISSLAVSINRMLDELERSQQQFLFLTENIHQIFWIKDAATSRFNYISSAFERIFGRPTSTLALDPSSWRELIHPEDRSMVDRILATQAAGLPTEAYFRITSEKGSIRWLWERSFPRVGPNGKHAQITGLTEDITDFKRNEEALLSARMELEARVASRTAELAERGELVKLLVDSAPGAMYGMDADGKCTFCNPAGLRLLGYDDPREVLGRNSHALFHHTRLDGTPYPQEDCPVFCSFHSGRDAHVADELFWRKDGTGFHVEYTSRQIRRNSKLIGTVVSFEDITDRKRLELELRLSQKLEAVGRIAAGIAHEINTPIQFVGDNTRFLQNSFQHVLQLMHKYQQLQEVATRGQIPPEFLRELLALREKADWDFVEQEIPRAMAQMLEGLARVSSIVRGMKEFSHVDRTSEKAPSDINRALQSTLVVSSNEIKYVAEVETRFGELPPVICHLADLNQVFLNLLVNAANAVEDVVRGTNGKGKIIVATRVDGDLVEVSVADNGTGIPAEVQDKIFDPFFTTKSVGKGTGQGLALARAIVVEKHGGTLTFETQPGKGTTFFVRLPFSGAPLREEALVK